MQNRNSSVEQQYRILTVVWFVLLFSQIMFLAVIYFSKPEIFSFDFSKSPFGENPIFVVVFAFLAITNLVISLAIKKRCVEQAIAEQKVQYVQTGLIVGCALCEAISLLGMVLAFTFSYQYFFLWFLLGVTGIILHFPKRDDVIAASYKK
jgi:magnesium-transporting ATPase (P-type)